ncbi:hypothetical protein LSCM4_06247 [Leishmania orientalis]|uniref:Uncharacterized protein n=1 Tax=Leishmania orientalis TaxID=2249476 RepID=A0A836HAB5_9TRYP|nr:hypothetical protein LSCM4_06247 [Leishmania orientalis]
MRRMPAGPSSAEVNSAKRISTPLETAMPAHRRTAGGGTAGVSEYLWGASGGAAVLVVVVQIMSRGTSSWIRFRMLCVYGHVSLSLCADFPC